ncbi:MAG: ABC transporter permease [Thermoflexales bacterium]|nr:ABC transporter permease [Thermoflexales bacterium]
MNTNKLAQSVRIIWAIAVKDVADAFRNRVILQIVLTGLAVVALYKAIPTLIQSMDVARLHVYDTDGSVSILLENSPDLDVRQYTSQRDMETFMMMGVAPELGLIIPSGFEQAVQSGVPLQLDGYVQYWVSPSEAGNLELQLEGELASLLGRAVDVKLEGHKVYPGPFASYGPGGWAVLSMFVVLLMVGISLVPHLMLEERQTRTLDSLLVSPASSSHVVLGKALAGLAFGLVGMVVVLVANAALITQWAFAILATVCGLLLVIGVGLLLGVIFEVKQSLKMASGVLFTFAFVPVAIAGMAMDLPDVVNSALRWIPTVALARLFCIAQSNQAVWADYGQDLAVVVVSIVLVLASVVHLVERSER